MELRQVFRRTSQGAIEPIGSGLKGAVQLPTGGDGPPAITLSGLKRLDDTADLLLLIGYSAALRWES